MKFPSFKKIRQRIGKLSSSHIAFVIIIFLFLVFIITSISVFLAHRGYTIFESQDLQETLNQSTGKDKAFLHHEIVIGIYGPVWRNESIDYWYMTPYALSIVLIDGNNIKRVDKQHTIYDHSKYICTTREFKLTIDQIPNVSILSYRVFITSYYYNPNTVILKIFIVFSVNWLICIGTIVYERYNIGKKIT